MRTITTVGTLIEHDGKILVLLRGGKEKNSPGTWGLAAGRLEEGEDVLKTAVREIQEETGLVVAQEQLLPAGVHIWHQPQYIVHFHAFRLPLEKPFEVVLDPDEHTAFAWKTLQEILELENPIAGLRELIEAVYEPSP